MTLGIAHAGLPPVIARFHYGDTSIQGEGSFQVRRGRSITSRLVGLAVGLPRDGRDVPLTLRVERDGGREVWDRSFDGHSVRAPFHIGRHEATESFGVLDLRHEVLVDRGVLRLRLRSARIRIGPIGATLPKCLAPRVKSQTWVCTGESSMHACVVVFLPVGGLLLAYRGSITEVM